MKSSRVMGAMLASATAIAPQFANACATCGLGAGDHGARAYQTSVLFMLAGPYVTFSLLCGIVFLAWRRAQRAGHNASNERD